jgi:hemolysin III
MIQDSATHLQQPLRNALRFDLSKSELIADGIVHAIGILITISAGSVLLALAFFHAGPWEYVAAIFYVASLLTVLSISCAYNLWPVSRAKWILRRFDHAAIYLLIAGTYTPFLAQLDDPAVSSAMMTVVWGSALVGIAMKLALPGRFDRLAVGFYFAIGWSGIAVARTLAATLPTATIVLVAAGGIVYSAGVVFFAWRGLRFSTAVWHGFVVGGAALHLAAVMDSLVIARL